MLELELRYARPVGDYDGGSGDGGVDCLSKSARSIWEEEVAAPERKLHFARPLAVTVVASGGEHAVRGTCDEFCADTSECVCGRDAWDAAACDGECAAEAHATTDDEGTGLLFSDVAGACCELREIDCQRLLRL